MKRSIIVILLSLLKLTFLIATTVEIGDADYETSDNFIFSVYGNSWFFFILPGTRIHGIMDVRRLEFVIACVS